MEENRKTKKDDNSSLYIYTALIILAMAAIAGASVYIPILIFTMLFAVPFVMRYDMETAKPILTTALAAACGAFLVFNNFNYSIFYILTAATGLSTAVPFIVWRFAKIEKFSDGMKYTLLGSAFVGVMAALVVFLINGREPFSVQIVDYVKSTLIKSDSMMFRQMLDVMYSRIILLEKEGQVTFGEQMQMVMNIINHPNDISVVDKVNKVLPTIESYTNIYSIFAILLYPAFAGGLAWWRGSYRFYKKTEMTDSVKKLKPAPFAAFTTPRWLVGIIVFLMLLSLILQMYPQISAIAYAAMVMQNFAFFLFGIQGLAVTEYFLKRTKVFRFAALRIIVMLLIGFVSAGIFFMFIGITDLFFNIRLVYTKTKEMKDKLNRMQKSKEEFGRKDSENKDENENKDDNENKDEGDKK